MVSERKNERARKIELRKDASSRIPSRLPRFSTTPPSKRRARRLTQSSFPSSFSFQCRAPSGSLHCSIGITKISE